MTQTHPSQPGASAWRERLQGILLCLIGAALALGMAAAAWQKAPSFLHPGELIVGQRFTGSSLQGMQALALMLSVSLTGLAFGAIGAHRLWTGRRDKRLAWLAAPPLLLTAAMGWLVLSWG